VIGVAAWQWRSTLAWANNLQAIFSATEYTTGLDTPEAVLGYIQQRSDDIALVSYTVDAQGQAIIDDSAVFHNADTPLPLASTMKIVILAAYAQQVEAGIIDPNGTVTLAEWQRYYLPGTDGGAHPEALAELGIATNEQGMAQNPQATATYEQLARAMIVFSDNAATDLLLERVGSAGITQVIREGGLQGQEAIQPILGTFLAWQNHTQPDQSHDHIQALAANPAAYQAEVARLTTAYADPAWRAAEQRWLSNGRPVADITFQELAGHLLLPKGTARDYATIMAGVISGTFLSPEISAHMRRHLEWPLAQTNNRNRFTAFGRKGGSLAGIRTSASFYITKTGDFAGQPRVVVLLMNSVPFTAWQQLESTRGNLLFTNELITRRAFAQQVRTALENEGALIEYRR
jgi:hypothetical protein